MNGSFPPDSDQTAPHCPAPPAPALSQRGGWGGEDLPLPVPPLQVRGLGVQGCPEQLEAPGPGRGVTGRLGEVDSGTLGPRRTLPDKLFPVRALQRGGGGRGAAGPGAPPGSSAPESQGARPAAWGPWGKVGGASGRPGRVAYLPAGADLFLGPSSLSLPGFSGAATAKAGGRPTPTRSGRGSGTSGHRHRPRLRSRGCGDPAEPEGRTRGRGRRSSVHLWAGGREPLPLCRAEALGSLLGAQCWSRVRGQRS